MKDNIKFKISPLSSSIWNDFVSLMKTDSQCSECWCLNHRAPAGCATGIEAQTKMNNLVNQNSVHGLLAFEENNPIGWIAVDPMAGLVGHDCHSTGKTGEWYRAKLISAFPIPHENRNKFPPNEAEFSGRFSTYSKMGFKPVAETSEFYQRVELVFE